MGKVCVFIGHRDAQPAIWEKLLAAVEFTINELGVTEFYVGGYGRFDSMAAEAVRNAKQLHPETRLYLIYAYLPVHKDDFMIERYDATLFLEGLESSPRRFAISKRNRWMVDQASAIIAYVEHGWGGAYQTLEYARKRSAKAQILNLGAHTVSL